MAASIRPRCNGASSSITPAWIALPSHSWPSWDRAPEGQPAEVPLREPLGRGAEHEVLGIAGGLEAHLGSRAVDQEPVAAVVADVEDEDPPLGGHLLGPDPLAQVPQDGAGVVVARRHLEPALPPPAERVGHGLERLA